MINDNKECLWPVASLGNVTETLAFGVRPNQPVSFFVGKPKGSVLRTFHCEVSIPVWSGVARTSWTEVPSAISLPEWQANMSRRKASFLSCGMRRIRIPTR